MRVAVVGVESHLNTKGGAERFLHGLKDAVNAYTPHKADLVTLPVDEGSWATVPKGYYEFHRLDLSAYDMVISTKCPSYMVQHENHVSFLVHTMRVFYDFYRDVNWKDYLKESPFSPSNTVYKRKFIHMLDTYALSPKRTRKRFSIGKTVQWRLERWNGISSRVLYPPPVLTGLHSGEYGYVLAVSRLHEWKRIDLAIRAMAHVPHGVRLKVVGNGEEPYVSYLKGLADGDPRIEFHENVDDPTLSELYANALAVVFTPIREDYGYVTVEAMLSRKPVITCSDSGETTEFVRNFHTGFVSSPDPAEIARYISYFVEEPREAERMGSNGFDLVKDITWEKAVQVLLGPEPMRGPGA